jgi:hypothetical protein
MPRSDERGVSLRYETKALSHWDQQEWAAISKLT